MACRQSRLTVCSGVSVREGRAGVRVAGHAGDVVVFGGVERQRPGGEMISNAPNGQDRAGANGGTAQMVAGSLIRVDVAPLTASATPRPKK